MTGSGDEDAKMACRDSIWCGVKRLSLMTWESQGEAGSTRAAASAKRVRALRAATTRLGGFEYGEMLERMADKAPAA
jgi:hypothetical protein